MKTPAQKLVYMANQIGRAFASRPRDEAIAEIANHLKSFWEKRMFVQIYAHIDAGGAGLDELPSLSLQSLRGPKT
jgi:formate dehydrogenase subunit delta